MASQQRPILCRQNAVDDSMDTMGLEGDYFDESTATVLNPEESGPSPPKQQPREQCCADASASTSGFYTSEAVEVGSEDSSDSDDDGGPFVPRATATWKPTRPVRVRLFKVGIDMARLCDWMGYNEVCVRQMYKMMTRPGVRLDEALHRLVETLVDEEGEDYEASKGKPCCVEQDHCRFVCELDKLCRSLLLLSSVIMVECSTADQMLNEDWREEVITLLCEYLSVPRVFGKWGHFDAVWGELWLLKAFTLRAMMKTHQLSQILSLWVEAGCKGETVAPLDAHLPKALRHKVHTECPLDATFDCMAQWSDAYKHAKLACRMASAGVSCSVLAVQASKDSSAATEELVRGPFLLLDQMWEQHVAVQKQCYPTSPSPPSSPCERVNLSEFEWLMTGQPSAFVAAPTIENARFVYGTHANVVRVCYAMQLLAYMNIRLYWDKIQWMSETAKLPWRELGRRMYEMLQYVARTYGVASDTDEEVDAKAVDGVVRYTDKADLISCVDWALVRERLKKRGLQPAQAVWTSVEGREYTVCKLIPEYFM
ncbi:protein ORF152 [Cyprinid herpesvirus 3]|uniref:ORF152R n=1 Tax=Cyprinid herpesvirus 3 TaxID=180230 RepID=A3QMW7_CYHV3|nr:unnamed protein product [Cyprinid herpesvirus 3]ABC55091.1 hypothetical protein [Cyprinid herpesvirus 3]ABG42979.1 protein ORF152 [Cyprinid herpesvirus 3]AIC32507.1 ORF152R [Cyprinid herpesvirus 3]AJP55639.1 protein ORF152 [Cyprinid herpesvirus 3]AJP55794.1 protein ORF152 [Cyprinid herpesvirus 3]